MTFGCRASADFASIPRQPTAKVRTAKQRPIRRQARQSIGVRSPVANSKTIATEYHRPQIESQTAHTVCHWVAPITRSRKRSSHLDPMLLLSLRDTDCEQPVTFAGPDQRVIPAQWGTQSTNENTRRPIESPDFIFGFSQQGDSRPPVVITFSF